MDEAPPPYGRVDKGGDNRKNSKDWTQDNRALTFAERIAATRSQHIAATVSKVQRAIEERMRYGIAKMICVLIPHGQCDLSRKHEIVDFGKSQKFIIVELVSEMDNVEFWEQPQAQQELKRELSSSLAGHGDKRPSLIRLQVRNDEIHIRSESPFGLFETVTVRAVAIDVET